MSAPGDVFRELRLRLPQPWALRLASVAYLPRLVRNDRGTHIAYAEEPLIERLVAGDEPLDGVGRGLSERVIEIPWVLRSLPNTADTRVLDIGTAFAPVAYKRLLMHRPETVELADLNEARIPGLRSHVADVRSLPFADASFDVATIISTLEHVGMDNAVYNAGSGGSGDVQALRELARVARRVLVTVPGGADANLGWFRQYAPATFRGRVAEAQLEVRRLEVFAYDAARGWAPAAEDAVGELQFGRDAYSAAALICAELTPPGAL